MAELAPVLPTFATVTALFLADRSNYWRYGRLDPEQGWLKPLEVPLGERGLLPSEVAGWWGRLGRKRAAYFVWAGELFLRVEDRQCRLGNPSLEIRLERGRLRNELVVRHAEGTLSFKYGRPFGRGAKEASMSRLTLSWPVDEEEVDFGVWVSRLAQAERAELVESWPFVRRDEQF